LIVLIISGIITGSVLIGGFLSKNQQNSNPTSSTTEPTQTSNSQAASSNENNSFTQEQVAQHSSPRDCWIIIDSGVYDVTEFLPQHPGGSQRITPYCGRDATAAFSTQDGQGGHS